MTIPNIATFDHGTYVFFSDLCLTLDGEDRLMPDSFVFFFFAVAAN